MGKVTIPARTNEESVNVAPLCYEGIPWESQSTTT